MILCVGIFMITNTLTIISYYQISNPSCKIKLFWFHIENIIHSRCNDYSDVIMGSIPSQITSLTIVNSTVYSGADQRKHKSSASLVFVRGIRRIPVNSPHKWPVTLKMFPFDDVIMDFIASFCVLNCLLWCNSYRWFSFIYARKKHFLFLISITF